MSPFVLIVIIAVVAAFVRGAGRARRSSGRGGSLIPLLFLGFILANLFGRSAQSVSIDPVALIWLGLAALPIVLVVALLIRIARRRNPAEASSLPTPQSRPPATRRPPTPPPVLRSESPPSRGVEPTPRPSEPSRRPPIAAAEPSSGRSTGARSTVSEAPRSQTPSPSPEPSTPLRRAPRSTTRSTSSLTRRKTASDELVERARKSLEMHRPTRRPRDDER